jgi:ribonuclease HI
MYGGGKAIEIRTDSRTCAGLFHRDLNRPIENTILVARFFHAISNYPNIVNIGWVRGHQDWEGNIYADTLTR